MRVINHADFNVPVKMWLDEVEYSATEQIENLARLPFAYKHIAIMPDSHMGYGMPIGAVLATEDVVIPNAVGVDIGCGMNAVKTTIPVEDITYAKIKDVVELAYRKIPVGNSMHEKKQDADRMPSMRDVLYVLDAKNAVVNREYDHALKQLGTLGGGNHFVELQSGDDGYMWIMLHSGSRHLGKSIGEKYNNIAVKLNKEWHSAVPPSYQLAFLPIGEPETDEYLVEMQYAMDYALASRKLMMERMQEAVETVFGEVDYSNMINIHHNFANFEMHYGKNVMVHRKGAVQAYKGQLGIIPSSQGTPSYITEGLGNRESFMSSSHGAGRVMGRKDAQRRLNLDEEIARMEGIVHRIDNIKALDEAPSAYKDMDTVMANQADLVKPLVKLMPLGNLKG